VYATFGVSYAIILGLLVSHGQTRRDSVSVSSVREAAPLVDIAQAVKVFGPNSADSLRMACVAYAEHVKMNEWTTGDSKQQPHERHVHFGQLWKIVRRIEPVGAKQEAVYRSMLNLLEYIASERYDRLAAAGDHMSPFLKVVLLIGAGVLFCFCGSLECRTTDST